MDLCFPAFDYKVVRRNGIEMIFDIIRKKYVVLTPEEWVRQHIVHFLIEKKGYPEALIALERKIVIASMTRRFDVVCFDKSTAPMLLIECKAPSISLDQNVFDQAFNYNDVLGARYVMISNGYTYMCCEIGEKGFDLCDIPSFTGS